VREFDPSRGIAGLGHRGPRVDTAKEAQLGAVHVADPRHHPLVEQRHPDGAVGVAGQIDRRRRGIPIRAEQVGAEMIDRLVLVRTRQHLENAEVETDRLHLVGSEHHPGLVAGLPPPTARFVYVPFAFHLQMGMDRITGNTDHQMFTA